MERVRLVINRISSVMDNNDWIVYFGGFGAMFGYALAEFGRISMFAGCVFGFVLAIVFLAVNWKPLTKELLCGGLLFGLLGSMLFQFWGLLVGLAIGPFIAYRYNVLVLKRRIT